MDAALARCRRLPRWQLFAFRLGLRFGLFER
jgi:hypothetical protein